MKGEMDVSFAFFVLAGGQRRKRRNNGPLHDNRVASDFSAAVAWELYYQPAPWERNQPQEDAIFCCVYLCERNGGREEGDGATPARPVDPFLN